MSHSLCDTLAPCAHRNSSKILIRSEMDLVQWCTAEYLDDGWHLVSPSLGTCAQCKPSEFIHNKAARVPTSSTRASPKCKSLSATREWADVCLTGTQGETDWRHFTSLGGYRLVSIHRWPKTHDKLWKAPDGFHMTTCNKDWWLPSRFLYWWCTDFRQSCSWRCSRPALRGQKLGVGRLSTVQFSVNFWVVKWRPAGWGWKHLPLVSTVDPAAGPATYLSTIVQRRPFTEESCCDGPGEKKKNRGARATRLLLEKVKLNAPHIECDGRVFIQPDAGVTKLYRWRLDTLSGRRCDDEFSFFFFFFRKGKHGWDSTAVSVTSNMFVNSFVLLWDEI